MRQFRMSGSVRGAAREGGSYRDSFEFVSTWRPLRLCARGIVLVFIPKFPIYLASI
jgi:hypothetical protein